MDISNVNSLSENQAAETMQEDEFKINTDDEEISTDDEKHKDTKKKKTLTKKRRKTNSKALSLLYEQNDVKDLLKKTAKDTQDHHISNLQNKVKNSFSTQLKTALTENMQTKTASLFQDKVLLKSTSNSNPILDETAPKQDSKKIEELKKNQKLTKKSLLTAAYLRSRPETNEKLKQYVANYSDNLIKRSSSKKLENEKLQTELKSKGITSKELIQIEKGAQIIIQKDLKKMLKQKFLNLAFSFDKKPTAELMANYEKYYAILNIAKNANIFNADPLNLKEFKETIKKETNIFLTQELDRTIVETKLKSDSIKDLMVAFDKLNNITGFVNFNPSEYMKTFHKKLDDQGLIPFISPDQKPPLDHESNSNSNKDDSQNQTPDQLIEETDLRNLYIKAAMTNKFFDKIKCKLTILKTESKCKKLNIDIEKLQIQANKVAKLRLKLEIRSLFEHRATLPELKGPIYKKFRISLKATLKSLKKLGHFINTKGLRDIRDQSNRSIFTFIKEDYIKNEIFLETYPKNTTLILQKKHYIKILHRLQSETKINESLAPKLLKDLHFLSDVNIIEAA
jgi:hypothetical protein